MDTGSMTFAREAWGSCDDGPFYAAKSCLGAGGERLLFGWIREQRPEAEQVAAGWSGVLSLPRRLKPGKAGALVISPKEAWLQEAFVDASVCDVATGPDKRVMTARHYR